MATMEKVAAVVVMALAGLLATRAVSQSAPNSAVKPAPTMPYADMPPAAVPYGRYRKPYKEWFVDESTLDYKGAARERTDAELTALKTVNIGFLGPLDADNVDSPYGVAMLHGSQMAV
ncbi:MAG TPA: hypothetical protein VMV98_08350, partial [Acidobacteriaceae bacterium]|nr:hypothetical protein [Acidobacteriaceae bacterium]